MHLLFEGAKLTRSQIYQHFGNNSSIFDDFLRFGMLRDNDTESGVINFVGVGVSNQHIIKFAPKILQQKSLPTDTQFRILIRTLKKYGKTLANTHPDAQLLRPNITESHVSQLAQANWLIADYLSKGLYRARPNTQIKQGSPTIDWVKTISRTNLTISNGRPVYLNPIGRTNQANNTHIVTRLHRYVIEKCFATYAPLLGFNNQTLDHEVVTPLRKPPDAVLIERVLKQELYRVFSDRAVQLLKILRSWFQEEQLNSSQDFKPYGVKNFWSVWEAVCKLIYHDEVVSWKPYIPAPLWSSLSGGSQHATGKWIPDVIMTARNKSGVSSLFILDAKYYDLRLPPHLAAEPGVGDITKQLFYNQVLKPAANKLGYKEIVNCLIFPSCDKEFIRVSGYVNIDGVSGGPILLIHMNAFEAFERYLLSSSLTNNERETLRVECLAAQAI
jgi:hypothetical protein